MAVFGEVKKTEACGRGPEFPLKTPTGIVDTKTLEFAKYPDIEIPG